MRDEKLAEIVEKLELTRKLITMDMYMAIFDKDRVVKYIYPDNGDVDGIKLGEVYDDITGKLEEAMETGEIIHNRIPSEKVGFVLEGNIVPLKDHDEVIGCVTMTYAPFNQKALEAKQIAVQSIYYFILSIDAINGNCEEIYKSCEVEQFKVNFSEYSKFCEQTFAFVHPEDLEKYKELVDLSVLKSKLENRNSISCECRITLKNDNFRWLEIIMSKVGIQNYIKKEEKYLYMVRDIHERKSHEEKANKEKRYLIEQLKMANEALFENGMSDELTHMYNRKGLYYFASKIFNESKKPGNILFVYTTDLNGLKYINDNFGHASGDNAIRVIGKIMSDSATEEAVCARNGGDEFVMLASYPKTSKAPYEVQIEIQERIEQYNQKSNLPYNVESSFGYFIGEPEENKSLDDYMTIADQRMYEMKKKSKEVKNLITKNPDANMRISDCGKNKILIADDDRFMRSILKSVFNENYIIIEVVDGNEALETIKSENNIALMLLDINMPKLDGFGVMDALQKSDVVKDIPIIMMTAMSDPLMEEEGYDKGVADFILKPFNLKIVKHRIDNVLQLYKKQKQLTSLLNEQVSILENQAKKLADQSEKLKDSEII